MDRDLNPHIERIARALLGEPNRALSSKAQLRFGKHGSIAVEIAGERRGAWFDHERNTGGTTGELVRHFAGVADSNGAASCWAREHLGIEVGQVAPSASKRIVAEYNYHGESGELLFQVCRLQPKTFRQRRPDAKGGWTWKVKGTPQVPYRLPELLAAPIEQTIYIAEGEKDVDRLRALGFTATCNPGGAGKWGADFARFFTGRDVVVLPDNDDAGRDHAGRIAGDLVQVTKRLRVLELPDLPTKGDVSHWVAAGGTRDRLVALAAEAPDFEKQADPAGDPAQNPGPGRLTSQSGRPRP